MALMSLQDAAFLLPETRDQPMHVGGLQLFQRPEGADRDFLEHVYAEMLAVEEVSPLFRRRAHRGLATLGQWAWENDDDLDLEHHVRHSALPRPGRIRELLALVSRLHSSLLDRQRPLWELHLIEGLEDGRFAVYSKLHHAVMDGVSGLRLMQSSLSTDPDDRSLCAPYLPRESRSGHAGGGFSPAALAGLAKEAVTEAVALGPLVWRAAERLVREQAAALPSPAPRTMLNGPITGSRRFAAQSWQLERLHAVRKAAGVTLNDVVLAMCSGALRTYLAEQDELPDASLVAMVPVHLASIGKGTSAGNNVGAILASLGTDEADPARRLETIVASMQDGKDLLAGLSRMQAIAMSAVSMAPLAMSSFSGVTRMLPPPFNLVISNVPGPKEPLWMQGARLDAFYPLSIPTVGQALNITVTSYVDNMEFGLTGCRRHVPHLQRLLTHLDTSLEELERAVG
ncbi:MAG TPA: wax ester/triacylglycerol synthase family O-acyltransferase [Mycobacteriales bacterium]|jgi:WS/DGAT/MGAT family acyltransferase|nr:wax ester/triacylglycerol synthase family O-acyltransferase [Mycobacteriales bacterium]